MSKYYIVSWSILTIPQHDCTMHVQLAGHDSGDQLLQDWIGDCPRNGVLAEKMVPYGSPWLLRVIDHWLDEVGAWDPHQARHSEHEEHEGHEGHDHGGHDHAKEATQLPFGHVLWIHHALNEGAAHMQFRVRQLSFRQFKAHTHTYIYICICIYIYIYIPSIHLSLIDSHSTYPAISTWKTMRRPIFNTRLSHSFHLPPSFTRLLRVFFPFGSLGLAVF